MEPRTEDGNLLANVLAHARDLSEHEEDEDAGRSAEVGCCG
jgi:hypothetical protein